MTTHVKRYAILLALAIPTIAFGVLLAADAARASIPTDDATHSGPRPAANPAVPTVTDTSTSCELNYNISESFGVTITNPGVTLVPGSQCDDCGITISLPFPYTLYGQTFTSLVASSNGQLDFGDPPNRAFTNTCLPDPYTTYAIFAHWDDLTMLFQNFGCEHYPGYPENCGIFTSVSGAAPNRIFNIEYRALSWEYSLPVHFEVRLYENSTQFDIIYAELDTPISSQSTVGIERDTGLLAEYQCPDQPNALVSGLQLTYTLADQCATPSPTAISTPEDTPTDTPMVIATDTPTNTRTSTRTATRTITPSATRTLTATPTNTPTYTPTYTSTGTSTATSTDTPVPTFTSTSTSTFTRTSTPPPTLTATTMPTDAPTDTPTSTPTYTSTVPPTDTRTPTNSPTVTNTVVAGSAILRGHVLLQSRPATPNPRWIVPVLGTLRLVDGGPNYDFATVTDDSGYFTVNTNLPPGDYLWRVKNPQTVANGGSATLGAGLNAVETGLLRAGDANNENCITTVDFNITKNSYGRSPNDGGYDPRADFNGDNLVTSQDFNLLKNNFGLCGEPPIPAATPTETPTPGVTLVGHITMQGRLAQPNPRQSVPISVTLRVSGGNPVAYEATTDQSGLFTITTGLAPGTYAWRVKHARTLANSGSAVLVAGTNNVEMGLMLAGDANNDNCITSFDFNILKVTFGKGLGDPGYDARADFNGDDQVTSQDFNLLKPNFGYCGAGPILRP